MRCPSPNIIESYLAGAGVDVSMADLEQHLSECGTCQQMLSQFVDDSPQPHETALCDGDWSDALADRLAGRVAHATTALDGSIDLPFYVGDYELLAEIGRGGMGTVYRARQLKLNRTVAVKMIVRQFLKPSLVDRFYVEARSAAMLDHPGIVPVYDVGQIGPYVFFAMAFVSGGTLAEHTKLHPVGAARAAELLKDVAAAVQFAHERGVIHRDLKPSNILLESNGRPKVADFGLAKQIESGADLTASGEVLGTPGYMPPEQAGGNGSVTTASDVYGLGAILFYLLTGRAPFEGDDAVGVIFRVVHEDPVAPRHFDSGVPLDLQTIALKCLAKRPGDRYESAGEVVRELNRYLGGEPIKARPPGPFGRLARWCRRRPALAAMVFATTMAILGGTAFSAYFGVLANQRAASLKIVNHDLAAKETEARSLASDAKVQATRATELAEKTMGMLELTLYDLQEMVVDNPAEQVRRRQLLNSVLGGLDGLNGDILEPQRVKRCRANTLLGLAEVAVELGDDAGHSGVAASQDLYQQAIDFFRELHSSSPDKTENVRGLAKALREYGDTLAEAGQWPNANEYFQEALPLCERLARESPTERGIQVLMADLEILCGEGYTHTGRLPEGKQMFQRSLERCQRMLETFPDDIHLRTTLTHASLELGDWYRLNKNRDEAVAYFTRMKDEALKTLISRPNDANVLLDLSTGWERLGDMSLAKGDRDLSLEQYIESMEIAERAGSTAPENNDLQWDVSFGYEKVASACLGMSKISDAKMYAQKCVNIRQRLALTDSANPRLHIKLFHALNTLTAACERRKEFDEAIKWHESTRDFAAAFNEKTGTNRFAAQITKAETRIAACREQLPASPGHNSARSR